MIRNPFAPRYTRPPSKPETPPRVSAVEEMMVAGENFDDLPLGGWGGEMLPTPRSEERPPPPVPFTIPPPPWQDSLERGDLDLSAALDPPPASAPSVPPVAAMMAADEPFDPPAPVAPLVLPPLERVRLPEPDWKTEARERERLEDERRKAERQKIFREELERIDNETRTP